jgi:hypothetical protein
MKNIRVYGRMTFRYAMHGGAECSQIESHLLYVLPHFCCLDLPPLSMDVRVRCTTLSVSNIALYHLQAYNERCFLAV